MPPALSRLQRRPVPQCLHLYPAQSSGLQAPRSHPRKMVGQGPKAKSEAKLTPITGQGRRRRGRMDTRDGQRPQAQTLGGGLLLGDFQALLGVPAPRAAWVAEGPRGRVAPARSALSRLDDLSSRSGTVRHRRGGRGPASGRARRPRRTRRALPPPLSRVPIPAPPDFNRTTLSAPLFSPPLPSPAPLRRPRSRVR